jgi:UDP-N-acetylmuramoylalanine--D-glutamate ligase
VAEKAGVLYVDDSKATTMDALQAALRSFDQPVLLLAGGRFKGGDPEALAPLIRDRVRLIGLFGESRQRFEAAWRGWAELLWEPSLEAAFDRVVAAARPGEVVLLSPGTSSFDLFEDYKARGRRFQELVNGL